MLSVQTDGVNTILYDVERPFGQHYLDPKANANKFFLRAKTQGIRFDGSGLVYERFLGFPNTDHPEWTWVGDQELFALSCYFNRQGASGVFDWKQATDSIKAVQANKKTASGVLHEDLAPYSEYTLDYACGKGTFMRCLAYINDDLHQALPSGAQYDPYIGLNAKAVWRNRQGWDFCRIIGTPNRLSLTWNLGEATDRTLRTLSCMLPV